jgi:small GTP-binding protein
MAKKSSPRGLKTLAQENAESSTAGLELVNTLEAPGRVWSIDFNATGDILGAASEAGEVSLWDVGTGKIRQRLPHIGARSIAFAPAANLLATGGWGINLCDARNGEWRPASQPLPGMHGNWVVSLAFDKKGKRLASGSFDSTTIIWNPLTREPLHVLKQGAWVWSVAFDQTGSTLVTVGDDSSVRLWDTSTGVELRSLKGHHGRTFATAFHPRNGELATGGTDGTVKLWRRKDGRLLRSLEGHTAAVTEIAYSPDGQILASKSHDQTIRLWSCKTFETVAIIAEPVDIEWGAAGLAFHPTLPLLAATGGPTSTSIHIWSIDTATLSREKAQQAIHHATAKIVLVGDHSVGKSGLAYRLITGTFKEQASTHGQQFWVYEDLAHRRRDGTDCEAILWDLAGQPDYRLVHALFVDNADLALVLFDSSDLHDPLHGVDFWLKQLEGQRSRCPIILVAAQSDRGTCSLTTEELEAFCAKKGIAGPIVTSAFTGTGIADLRDKMRSLVVWEDKAATVTTETFKRIKDYVLGLKEKAESATIVTPQALRASLEGSDPNWRFADIEMFTALGHLENYGYVKRLQTSSGGLRVLLQPEYLNNLASSFVLEARRHPKGLGALEERRLLADGYDFQELRGLTKEDREVMLDSAALLFLEHHVCFREVDPLRMEPYLVFPELINLKKPPEDTHGMEDMVTYRVSGSTENLFASLVVLLGYTHTFTRTAQWHDNARYEIGEGLTCAFRQHWSQTGELDLVLSYGRNVAPPIRALFQGLFESFLGRRNVTVIRYQSVQCGNPNCRELLESSVLRQRIADGKTFAFCNECGERLDLPKAAEPIQMTQTLRSQVETQRQAAEQRTRFEQVVFRLLTYTAERKIPAPETFISYAWGSATHEWWVEKRLAPDLQKAGIQVILDRWHNAIFGQSLARFIEKIETADKVVMVGTSTYRSKYDNRDSERGFVVAAEVDLINNRLTGTEEAKLSVVPVLLEGKKTSSLPPLVHGRLFADFRDEAQYFGVVFDLILSLYGLGPHEPFIQELRETLKEHEPSHPQPHIERAGN